MSRKYLAALTAFVAIAALTFAASATSSGATGQAQARAAAAAQTTTKVGAVSVRFQIKRFIVRGKRIFAVGYTVSRFSPTAANPQGLPTKTVRKAFRTRVLKLKVKRVQAAKRICPVLDLTLAPVDLSLLGLMVHLDRVHLTITANSNGGLLGSLLCGLANNRFTAQQIVLNWTRAAQQSGLATRGVQLSVPLYQTTAANGSTSLHSSAAASPMVICTVLDLRLGPLDLNLLGLMIHLDRVHLLITADSEGGILGSLLCSLAGGGTAARS